MTMSKAGLSAALRCFANDRLAFALVLTTLTIAVGVTYGSWTISGTGNGYSKAVTAQSLTTVDVSGSATAQLYPGGTGDLIVRASNPNPFAVTITAVSGNGTITSDKGASCNASTGVTYTDTTGLSQAVAAGGAATFTLANKVSMSNASDNACQGAIFTVPISITATS